MSWIIGIDAAAFAILTFMICAIVRQDHNFRGAFFGWRVLLAISPCLAPAA